MPAMVALNRCKSLNLRYVRTWKRDPLRGSSGLHDADVWCFDCIDEEVTRGRDCERKETGMENGLFIWKDFVLRFSSPAALAECSVRKSPTSSS